MAKPNKTPRPKAIAPRGFKDDFGQVVRHRNAMLGRLADLYHLHGFEPLESSAVETVEALGKFLPDVDRPNEGVFAWQDEAEGWLALRYDLTAPLARVAAQYRNDLPSPYRRYAIGPVWRNEKPGPGRFRQFYQCDADTVGSANIAADAEMVALMAQAIRAVGIGNEDFIVKVNNRKVLNGVMEAAGLYDPTDPEAEVERRGIVLRTVDKFDRFGEAGLRQLLGEGRRDESGDFTKGAGLAPEQIERVLAFVGATRSDNSATLGVLTGLIGASELGRQGVDELATIADIVSAQGFDEANIKIDPSVVRGLGYYTGPVMEAELTFEIFDDKGRKRQFGSVAGGGRYDDLVKRFTGQSVPAVGISIGVDRLLAALAMRGAFKETHDGPVIVTVMERDRMLDYQKLVDALRVAGIRAELFLGNPKNFGNQLKYADQRRSRFAVIQGSDERAAGTVQVKDLVLGARLASEIEDRSEWANQPAQETIATANLVAFIKAKLAQDI